MEEYVQSKELFMLSSGFWTLIENDIFIKKRVIFRCRPIWFFLLPMPMFRNQGSLLPIYDADFFGPISVADLLYLIFF